LAWFTPVIAELWRKKREMFWLGFVACWFWKKSKNLNLEGLSGSNTKYG
jgi:hypothetical protein